jgi:hypothetical protein
MRVAALALLLCFGCATPPPTTNLPAVLDDLPILRTRVTLDLEAPLSGWLDALHQRTGVRFRIDSRVPEFHSIGDPVRLHLHEMTASTALKWILSNFQCDYEVQDGIVVVRAPETAGTISTVLRTYPFRATNELRYPAPPTIELGENSKAILVVPPPPPKPDMDPERGPDESELLLDLIKENVVPGTWEGAQTIESDGQGNLLVNAPVRVHQNLQVFLDLLAESDVPSITVAIALAEGESPLRIVPADRVEETLRTLRKNRALEVEVSGPERDFVHAVVRRENVEAAHLFSRASLVEQGRSVQIDFRLAVGRSGGTKSIVARIGTSVRVPNGGGVLLTLPGPDDKPQLCLVRAVATNPDPPRAPRFLPYPAADGAGQRLANAPAAPLDLDGAPLDDLAAWLRKTTGLTVFLPRTPPKGRLTFHADAIRPIEALPRLLSPLQLRFCTRNEAILINDSSLIRDPIRIAILDARDTSVVAEFNRGDLANYFTDEDLANLMKNALRRNEWEEADGKSLMLHRGNFYIHNTESVLRDCIDFIDARRKIVPNRVAFRAETVDLPVDELGGAGAGVVVDGAQRDRLLAAGRRTGLLEWTAFEGQKSCVEWERSRNTTSFMETRALLRKDGRAFDVGLDFHDGGEASISTATTVEIPVGRTAIFRSAAGGRARILLVTPSLLR